MKAKLFVAALATLAFASCSETETVEMPSSAAIKFDNVFVGNSVRAAIEGVDGLESFKVFAGFDGLTNVYDNTVVTRGGSSDAYTWTPAYTAYWQEGKTYKFQAYASEQNGVASENGVNFTDYTVANEAVETQEDLLVTDVVSQEGQASGNATVGLTFRHALSMVKFTIKNGFAGKVDLKVTGLTLKQVNTKGNYTNNGATGTWSAQNTPDDFVFGDIAETIAVNGSKSTVERIVLPQNVQNLEVTFNVTATGALAIDNQPIKVTLPNVSLEEGKRVNFVATINEKNIDPDGQLEPIVFNPSVNPWEGYADNADGTVTPTPQP